MKLIVLLQCEFYAQNAKVLENSLPYAIAFL